MRRNKTKHESNAGATQCVCFTVTLFALVYNVYVHNTQNEKMSRGRNCLDGRMASDKQLIINGEVPLKQICIFTDTC